MGVNYFSHFLLTNLLYPLLQKSNNARVVTLSSLAHKRGKIDFDNLNAEKGYSRIGAYSQSKLACLIFAYELQRRLEKVNSSIIAVSAHPGASNTELSRHIPKWVQTLLSPLLPLFTHSPEKGALPILYVAIGEDVKGGEYFGPTGFNGMKGKPGKVKSEPHSHDKMVAQRLWEVSEKLTGEKFEVRQLSAS